MSKKLLFLLVALITISFSIVQAQAPDTLWTRYFGIGTDNLYGSCVIQDNGGGYVITGSTGNIDPDTASDMYLVKADSDGNLVWQRRFGGLYWDAGRYLCQTKDGGYIIIGETESLGHGEMEYPDVYLVKTDSVGNQEWYKTFDWGDLDNGNAIATTDDNGYILTGSTRISWHEDMFLIKTDSLGNVVWQRTYGEWLCVGYSIRQTADHGYIIAGIYDDTTLTYFGGYLLKVDSLGNEQWCRHYHTYTGLTIYGVDINSDGGYIMTGLTGVEQDFNIFLRRVDANGDEIWANYYDIGRWDWGFTAHQTAEGGFIMCGFVDSGDIFNSDGYILKTDANGETEWDLRLGGSHSDLIRSIRQTPDGGYIACGNTVTDENSKYIWLIRLAADGTPVDYPDIFQPSDFTLNNAFPNPFNSSTLISYQLPELSRVRIIIYDMLGREVEQLTDESQAAGTHKILWDGSGQKSGVYFYKVMTDFCSHVGKMTLLK